MILAKAEQRSLLNPINRQPRSVCRLPPHRLENWNPALTTETLAIDFARTFRNDIVNRTPNSQKM
jgi:hypothetical protein